MTRGELIQLLNQWDDDDMEVKLRVSVPEEALDDDISADEIDGSYLNITDDRSVLLESGNLVIIGDLPYDD